MSAVVALRHEERPVTGTRRWTASQLASTSRLGTPTVRHLARRMGDHGPGVEIVADVHQPNALAVVARLWLGVLSIFLLIVFLGLTVIILGAWAFGYRPVVVTSGSMEPSVRTGDVVITKPVDVGDEVGDQTVIDFDDPATMDRRLHRVIEVTDSGYRTKGDANATVDPQEVPPDHVHGAGFVLAPFVGYVPLWVQQGEWPKVAAVGGAVVALAVMSRRRWMWGAQR